MPCTVVRGAHAHVGEEKPCEQGDVLMVLVRQLVSRNGEEMFLKFQDSHLTCIYKVAMLMGPLQECHASVFKE
eukprot:1149535-Pelagomonas_calceolata.AAC.5